MRGWWHCVKRMASKSVFNPARESQINCPQRLLQKRRCLLLPTSNYVQPHPEFGDQVIAQLAGLKGPSLIPNQLLTTLQTNLGKPNANQKLAAMISQFFSVRHISWAESKTSQTQLVIILKTIAVMWSNALLLTCVVLRVAKLFLHQSGKNKRIFTS